MESRWHLNLLKIDQKTIRIKNNDQTVKEVPRINVWRPAMSLSTVDSVTCRIKIDVFHPRNPVLPLLLGEREVDGASLIRYMFISQGSGAGCVVNCTSTPPSIHTLVNALPKAGPAVGEAALTLARCDLGNKDIQAPQKSLYTLLYTL